MTTRREMTTRIHELWANPTLSVDDMESRLLREFPHQPPSVHDAAWTAAVGEIALRLRDKLGRRIAEYDQAHADA
jgi:hypothetical protein